MTHWDCDFRWLIEIVWHFNDSMGLWPLDDVLSSWYSDDSMSLWHFDGCLDGALSSWDWGDWLSWDIETTDWDCEFRMTLRIYNVYIAGLMKILKYPLRSTLQHCADTLQHKHTATHCNTLQHTATHCNTQYHTAIHCSTLQHTATHCNTL